jgi:hypothetical protein
MAATTSARDVAPAKFKKLRGLLRRRARVDSQTEETERQSRPPEHRISLADALAEFSAEMRTAQQRAANAAEPALFEVRECSLELQVAVDVKGSGKVDWWVVGAEAERSLKRTQRIVVTVQPRTVDITSDSDSLPKNINELLREARRQLGGKLPIALFPAYLNVDPGAQPQGGDASS